MKWIESKEAIMAPHSEKKLWPRREVRPKRMPKGSVLIFAVTLVVLLLAVGVAFAMYVVHAQRTAQNISQGLSGELIVESGANHAQRVIREALESFKAFSPDATFDPTSSNFKFLEDPEQLKFSGNPFRVFEYYKDFDEGTNEAIYHQLDSSTPPKAIEVKVGEGYGFLFWRKDPMDDLYEGPDDGFTAPPPHFSDLPLTVTTTAAGAPTGPNFHVEPDPSPLNGPLHYGLAFGYTVEDEALNDGKFTFDQFVDADKKLFTKGKKRARLLPPLHLPAAAPADNHFARGEYYIWIADLDARLYSKSKTDPAPGDRGWEIDLTGVAGAPGEADLRKNVFLSAGLSYLDGTEQNLLRDLVAAPKSLGELTGKIATLGGHLDWEEGQSDQETYLADRYELERLLTFYRDDSYPANPAYPYPATLPVKWVKEHPAALNVNTASREVIAAVLWQVPMLFEEESTNPDPPTKDSQNKEIAVCKGALVDRLAARICAKRPFVSRMDFEDFLAAQINSIPMDPTNPLNPQNPSYANNVFDITDASKINAIASPDDAAVVSTPIGMLSAAILKRIAVRVDEFLDMDGWIDPTDPAYPGYFSNNPLYKDCVLPAFQQKRIQYFRATDESAPLGNALISVKAFNNILNSLFGKRPDGTYGMSYYTYNLELPPYAAPFGNGQKFKYTPLDAATITSGTKKYSVALLSQWTATKSTGYYEMVMKSYDDEQLVACGDPVAMPMAPVIAGGGDGIQIYWMDPAGDDKVVGADIQDVANMKCDSSIEAPLRSYRHIDAGGVDAEAAYDPAGKPTAGRASGSGGNGDVSWSPRFCFRSRFYAIYVLGRSFNGWDRNTETYRSGPFKRLELVYDALLDKVVSRRAPASEMRTLSDPTIPPP